MSLVADISDMIIEGILCQECGCIMEDLIPDKGEQLLEGPGHPRSCEDCDE